MKNNILILAVVVTALSGWLLLSLAAPDMSSGQAENIVDIPSDQKEAIDDGIAPLNTGEELEVNTSVKLDSVKTSVTID
jgi:hypothetical protein